MKIIICFKNIYFVQLKNVVINKRRNLDWFLVIIKQMQKFTVSEIDPSRLHFNYLLNVINGEKYKKNVFS